MEYGNESIKPLKIVMLQKPDKALEYAQKCGEIFPNDIPNTKNYQKEHEEYEKLLISEGVEVLHTEDYVHKNKELLLHHPNLTYMHDTAVITRSGAIISKMIHKGRPGEEIIVKEALTNLNIPIFFEFDGDDRFESCLIISKDIIFIANTERHCIKSIEKLIPKASLLYKDIIVANIKKERRFMHADMIFDMINDNLALIYLPAFICVYKYSNGKKCKIDIVDYFKSKDIELINISDDEQLKWGCSIVPLNAKKFICYDISLSEKTKRELYKKNIDIIEFHTENLIYGGGSLRCLTLIILRK